jgi:hypothetical protein
MITVDLPTAIETLCIAEEKTREVRQSLEAQLRRETLKKVSIVSVA